jgi:vacuolar-type H+-ATPase subunit C/Vma6
MEQLARTRYARLVEELYQLLQTNRFSPMERFFERLLMRNVRQSARNNVFGIGVMMDFVWLKYNEAINLRLIARGLAGNLPHGRVRDELYSA